ncbi:glutathione S-transferase family protein [Maricaulis sp. D1M11]|uniref:glutathione S-transferase family protein n=1 Tax=Maricaulis sp. D1M11 TaxID=3076117 RepID=UPI0039B4CFA2
MPLTLYTFSGAPRGWRVHLGLVFKGLSADVKYLSASDKDHHKPDFLALNPRAKTPVLATEQGVIRDSIAILAWLDRQYPERPLFGTTTDDAAQSWQIVMECCDYLRDGNHALLSRVFSSVDAVADRGTPENKEFEDAAALVHAEFSYLEEILADGRRYLGGERPGAADAVAFPEIRLVQRGCDTKPIRMTALGFDAQLSRYPHLSDWKDRLHGDAGVMQTMPPHWAA